MPPFGDFVQFVREHPEPFLATFGFLIPLLIGIIGFLFKHTLDAMQAADVALRTDLIKVMERHGSDVVMMRAALVEQGQGIDEKIDRLACIMLEQWERFYAEMTTQGQRLATLEGEHRILFGQHTRRHGDRSPVDPENGGGD